MVTSHPALLAVGSVLTEGQYAFLIIVVPGVDLVQLSFDLRLESNFSCLDTFRFNLTTFQFSQ